LVGAGQGSHERTPFVVVFDPTAKDDKKRLARCTGDCKLNKLLKTTRGKVYKILAAFLCISHIIYLHLFLT
jgi:hypothetical protein